MAVPENVVKTSDFDFFSQEEAEVFDNTVGIKRLILLRIICVLRTCAKLPLRSYLKNGMGEG